MPPSSLPPSPPWWQRLDPRSSLPARATLIFGGAALALVLLLAESASGIMRQQIQGQVGASFENLAYQVGDKLERTIYERYHQLKFTASLSSLSDAQTSVADRQRVLDALHDASSDFAWVGFADARGTILAASQRLFVGEKADDLPWFRGARRQLYVGPVREFPELAGHVPAIGGDAPRFLDLAVPVTSATGEFLGVLGAQIRWSWAREVQLSVVPDSARRQHLGVTVYAANRDVVLDSGGSGWTIPPEAPPNLSDRPAIRGVITEQAAGDVPYLAGYAGTRGFREYRGQRWLVVVRQPFAEAFAPAQDLHRRIVRTGLALVVALGLVTWIVSARLERRFRAIAAAAQRIGEGDVLSLMPQPSGTTALDRTCAALGDLVEKFRRRQDVLEAENARLAARESDRIAR